MKTINNKMTKKALEQLEVMNGCEVNSLTYEGIVGIEGNKLHIPHLQKTIKITTSEQVQELYNDFIEALGLYY